MKYAIHKLKQILESDQILFPVEREQIERAIFYLSDITQCTSEEWDLNPELNGLLRIKTIDGLKVEDGPYAKEFAIEQHRLDMEATNREEAALKPVVTQTFCVVDLARLCTKPQTYVWTKKELWVEIDRRKPAGYSLDKVEEGSDSYLRVATFKRIVPIEEQLYEQGLIGNPESFEVEGRFTVPNDDDLGELDPTKACDLSKEGGCESCS